MNGNPKCRFKDCGNESAPGKKTCVDHLKKMSERVKGKKKKNYTDDERNLIISVLESNDGDVSKTERETGCPYNTILCWKMGWRHPDAMLLHRDKGGSLAKAAEELAWKIAGIIPRKLEKAPLNHLATGFGIMVDKVRILNGLPTTINQDVTDDRTAEMTELFRHMTPDERDQVRQLFEKASERRDTPATIAYPAIENPERLEGTG